MMSATNLVAGRTYRESGGSGLSLFNAFWSFGAILSSLRHWESGVTVFTGQGAARVRRVLSLSFCRVPVLYFAEDRQTGDALERAGLKGRR